ncbi:hypothetical protein V6N13_125181 [Hibiscus sabdariffa]
MPHILVATYLLHFKLSKETYDGTRDPTEHLSQYKNYMDIIGASYKLRCKAFSMTLPIDKIYRTLESLSQFYQVPIEPSAAATHKHTASAEKDGIDPEDPDDNVKVGNEVDNDVFATGASTTDAAATPRSNSPIKKR